VRIDGGGRRARKIIVLGMGCPSSQTPMQRKEEAVFPPPRLMETGKELIRLSFDCKFR
jgi:hypothetical protein